VIANNPGIAPHLPNCKLYAEMNCYICKREHLSVMMFESGDDDTEDRNVAPIFVQLKDSQIKNKINSMMDHMWDGFYAGQIHLSRFSILLDAEPKSIWNVTMSGSPPKNLRFKLTSLSKVAGSIIRIPYPGAESRSITKDDKIIEYNQWNETLHMYGPVKGDFCGENRYVGVKNILEFYLDTTCELKI